MPLRLGKLPAKKDRRTLRLATVLRALPPIPDSFDVDIPLGGIPVTPMFANDTFGDCVIAGRAHHTLRLEKFEQNKLLQISDQDVINEYFKETGGADSGLYMLDSLNAWRRGWLIGSQKYTIDAFGIVNHLDWEEVRAVMYLLNGTYTGLLLPATAQDQSIWEVVPGPGSEPGSWGSHCIFVKRVDKTITKTRLTCITWGREQELSLEFFQAYCDEAFGVVDSLDDWMDPATDPLDVQKLRDYLAQLIGDQPLRITSLTLPAGVIGQSYPGCLYATGGKPPYTWSINTGALPEGVSLDEKTGVISGMPVTAGTTLVIFICTDAAGSATGVGIWIQVNSEPPPPPPAPSPSPVPAPSTCPVGNGIAGTISLVPRLLRRRGRFYYRNPNL